MRRPVLENESYWDKSDSALFFIAGDAAAAAHNMQGMDEKAEGKYLDQMNDALTVMHYRKHHPEVVGV